MPGRAIVRPLHLLLIAAGTAMTALGWYAPYAGGFGRTLAVIGAQAGIFGIAAVAVFRRPTTGATLALVLLFAAVLRLAALDYTPFLSSDVYRYVWDGRVQAAGVNPYRYLPADSALAELRDDVVYPNMNRRDSARTIYPPVAEALFFAITRIHDSVFAMRLAMVLFEAVAIAGTVVLLGWLSLPPARVLLFAWHPLAIWEIASSGHLDAVVLAAMAGALLAQHRGRSRLAVVLVALGGLVKLYPFALLPVFWRRWDWRTAAIVITMVAAAYGPYAAGVGLGVLGYLPGYISEEGFQTGDRFFLIDVLRRLLVVEMSPASYMSLAAIGLGGLAAWAIARGPWQGVRLAHVTLWLAAAATLAVSPSYPWYFLWLLPCLPAAPSVSLLAVTLTGLVQYIRHVPGTHATGFDLNVVQYGGFALVAAVVATVRLVRRRRTHTIWTGDPA
jgi:hypothetical protein